MSNKWESNVEIQRIREYLRIPTVSSVEPRTNYDECIAFLKLQAHQLSLPIEIHHPFDETKPIAIITWLGTDPSLSSIILNSHMDVVPVYEELWTHPPFGAEMDEAGRIFARGSQDMKSVGMQYLGAISVLKSKGVRMKRTIHVTFVPDEELGGDNGMKLFVQTEAFKRLNVGFSLDEGIASPNEVFPVFYAERSIWRVNFICNGTTGHGSLLHENTAGEKLRHILDRMMDYRTEQAEKLKNNPKLSIGDVTTVNLTIIKGGLQSNVVPSTLAALFDCRLALDVDHNAFEEMLNNWCKQAGDGVRVEFKSKKPKVQATPIDDSNPFWKAFHDTLVHDLHLKIEPLVFPGRTDSCYIREVGIPALGFSPLNNTPVLLHDNDEFIWADVYLAGVTIYAKLIEKISNV